MTILGGISAAISYTHIIQLAHLHHETGWRTHALPVSIDGLEVVASLVLLAEHRAGQRPEHHWLPWIALAAGTVASLTANVLIAEPTLIGRTISAWPAIAFLAGLKLGSRMLSHAERVPVQASMAATHEPGAMEDLADPPPPVPPALHPHQQLLAQPGRALVRRAHQPRAAPFSPPQHHRTRNRRPPLDQRMEQRPQAVRTHLVAGALEG